MLLNEIEYSDFQKLQLAVGTIVEVKLNAKARIPAYILTVDFGELGTKISSAQITENYKLEDLEGQQVVAVMNFPIKRVAGVKSEVLVLASVSDHEGTVLLAPTLNVTNGTSIS